MSSLLISSDVSIISASITSYSPFKIVYAVSIVPLCTCFNILDTVKSNSDIAVKPQISIAEGYREKREYKKGIELLNSIISL